MFSGTYCGNEKASLAGSTVRMPRRGLDGEMGLPLSRCEARSEARSEALPACAALTGFTFS